MRRSQRPGPAARPDGAERAAASRPGGAPGIKRASEVLKARKNGAKGARPRKFSKAEQGWRSNGSRSEANLRIPSPSAS
jgi:hypothetical protein